MTFNKIFYGIWIFLFALFAFWQLNDVDPEVWVTIYAMAMLFCVFAVRGIFPKIPLTIVVVVCVLGAIYFFPGGVGDWISDEWAQKDLTMKTPAMEENRETFGLMIIALVLSPALYKAWKGKA
ncbi:transmembrane 220 family protein [Algoriphagus halophytocola]|uniref:Transmembrane 220 family protein n=1 Tax=Algoriphagus halophytocola TaxID=2991499 RepID=A0ABY6MJ24_9BACT|nr:MULTISPECIES: transmembrane 220 family protein [unclassified Algoriphagus]UZD22666.1 transmembrane 220 family protein [Algoriphagus sp. TR-M5]WBL43931.1 transmembrane 220 family protein [Algoriphagus sp. TR-M9]